MAEQYYYDDGTPIIINTSLSHEELAWFNSALQQANDDNNIGKYDKALSVSLEILEKLCDNKGNEEERDVQYMETILNILSFNYHVVGTNARYMQNYESALLYFEKSLQLSTITNNKTGEARAYGNLGLLMSDRYKMTEEMGYYKKALLSDTQARNKSGMAMWLNNIALMHGKNGEYAKALELFTEALTYDIEIGNEKGKASRLMNIAVVHMYIENFDTALEYLKQSLIIEEKINNVRGIAKIYNNIAAIKSAQKEYTEAIEFFRKSLAIDEKLEYKNGMSIVLGNLGDMYVFIGDYETALEYLLKSLALETALENKRGMGIRMTSIGACYALRNRYVDDAALAEEFLLKGLALSEEAGNKQHLITCHEQLAKLYESQSRLEESIKHYKLHFEADKEIRNKEAQNKAAQIEFIIKTAEQEKELAVERARAEEKEFMIDELTRANIALSHTIERVELLNEQLHAANNTKNDVIGVVAHDLKNPLTSIILNTDMMKRFRSRMSETESEKILSGIANTAKRMNEIIGNLLDIHALESGKMNISSEPLDIKKTIERVLDENKAQAEIKLLQILCEMPDEIPFVKADATGTEQIFDNLISNAIKYSPPDKNIYVKCIVKENVLHISVRDEGPGIKPEEMDKLFGKFQKLSAKPTGGESSTGLGLSVAKMLAEQMNGSLWCESVQDEGANFILELPFYKE